MARLAAQRRTTSPSAASIAASVSSSSDDAGRGGVGANLLGPARADDRRGDVLLAQHPGERQLDHRQAGLPRRRPAAAATASQDRLGSISRSMKPPMLSLAARESAGGGAARAGTCRSAPPGPAATTRSGRSARARTAGSPPPRASATASSTAAGWRPSAPRRAAPATRSILSAGHSLKPMWRALPARTTSLERRHRLLQRRLGVVAVALVEVDVVGLQPLQRGVDLLVDLRGRQPPVGVGHREVDLRGEHVGGALASRRAPRRAASRRRRARRRWRCR